MHHLPRDARLADGIIVFDFFLSHHYGGSSAGPGGTTRKEKGEWTKSQTREEKTKKKRENLFKLSYRCHQPILLLLSFPIRFLLVSVSFFSSFCWSSMLASSLSRCFIWLPPASLIFLMDNLYAMDNFFELEMVNIDFVGIRSRWSDAAGRGGV